MKTLIKLPLIVGLGVTILVGKKQKKINCCYKLKSVALIVWLYSVLPKKKNSESFTFFVNSSTNITEIHFGATVQFNSFVTVSSVSFPFQLSLSSTLFHADSRRWKGWERALCLLLINGLKICNL